MNGNDGTLITHREADGTRLSQRDLRLALMVALIWGVNFVVIRVGLDAYPPLLLVSLRFLVVAVIGTRLIPRPDMEWGWLIAIGLFLGAGQFGFLFLAMDKGMPAGPAAVVLQIQAAFTMVLALVVLGERPSRGRVVGMAVAVAGLVLLAIDAKQRVAFVGFSLTLVSALSWALGNIVIRRQAQAAARLSKPSEAEPSGLAVIVWASLIPPVPLFVLSLVLEGPTRIGEALGSLNLLGIGAILYLAGLATYVGFGTWTSLLSRYPASTVAPFSLLVPPVGLIAAWLILGEQPTGLALFGSAIVVGGLALSGR